ncbi:MAG TPA: GPW/gp25 family protein [Methanoregulaceae archaeon]|nr:GPW/gp25 family protein [Methanoregulaceae archaeon]
MKPKDGGHLSYPFRIGSNGRTAQVESLEEHVLGELAQMILTNPGERPFLPEFGGGARRLVFENVGEMESGIIKAKMMHALSEWLGERLTIEDLAVTASNGRVDIVITYRVTGSEDTRIVRFQRPGE